jgi:predicted nucleotide-binding protein (sugar kinase/HSP70/actin superfamily)
VTTKETVNLGVKLGIDEICLPVKCFLGHVNWLKSRVDMVFIPRIISTARGKYECPKVMALPDLARASIQDMCEIIDVRIDYYSGRGKYGWVFQTGEMLGMCKADTIASYAIAYKAHKDKKLELVKKLEDRERGRPRIAVLGHPYNLADRYTSMDAISKLEELGAEVVLDNHVPDSEIKDVPMLEKPVFWHLGHRILGAAVYLAENDLIDGCCYINAFGCGVDSIIGDLTKRVLDRFEFVPFLNISLDEHTGEAGVQTRLEAFMDLLMRRRKG